MELKKRPLSIAFDVDGTLMVKGDSGQDVPNYSLIMVLAWFCNAGHEVYVWSGGGVGYAENVVRKLGLEKSVTVIAKGSKKVAIAFDDELVSLGITNVQV